jgi:hypothetical protein
MNDNDLAKSLKVVSFDGSAEKWPAWSDKFKAIAKRRGYHGVLIGRETVPAEDDVLDPNDEDEKLLIASRNANDYGYGDLLLCCDGVAYACIAQAKTKDLPEGSLALAWSNLRDKYEGDSFSNLVELRMEFDGCVIKDIQADPDHWFDKLQYLQFRLGLIGTRISETDMAAHILQRLPTVYSELVTNLEGLDRKSINLNDLKKRIRMYYKRKILKINATADAAGVGGQEMTLGAFKLDHYKKVSNVAKMATKQQCVGPFSQAGRKNWQRWSRLWW